MGSGREREGERGMHQLPRQGDVAGMSSDKSRGKAKGREGNLSVGRTRGAEIIGVHPVQRVQQYSEKAGQSSIGLRW